MSHPSAPPAPDGPSPLDRRAFLGRLAALGAVGFAASTLAACGGGSDGSASGGARVVDASSCPGYDGLPEQQLQLRQSLAYVDESPNPAQHCANCRFYNQPEGGSPCGGCQLFQGPVSPGGWCRSWAAMPA